MAKLIDDENKWDETKLNQFFMQEDMEVILKIPLPRNQKEDELLWHYDKRGEYYVKSGYQITLKIKALNLSNSSNCSSKRQNVLSLSSSMKKSKFSYGEQLRTYCQLLKICGKESVQKIQFARGVTERWKSLITPCQNAKQQRKFGFILHFQSKLKMAQTKTFSVLSMICSSLGVGLMLS